MEGGTVIRKDLSGVFPPLRTDETEYKVKLEFGFTYGPVVSIAWVDGYTYGPPVSVV